jgi:hypothetical protein
MGMSNITVATLLSRAGVLLQDIDEIRWTSAEKLGWLNDGQRELAKLKPDAKIVTRSMTLEAGAQQTIPSDCIAMVDLAYNADGSAITLCDRATLDRFKPCWQIKPTASTVRHWMRSEDPNVFYVYPPQSGTPGSVEIVAGIYPNTVGLSDKIDVRDIYADNLVNFILYRAYSKDAEFGGDASRAVAYYQAFAS